MGWMRSKVACWSAMTSGSGPATVAAPFPTMVAVLLEAALLAISCSHYLLLLKTDGGIRANASQSSNERASELRFKGSLRCIARLGVF